MGRMKDKITGHVFDGKEYIVTTTTDNTGPLDPNKFTVDLPKDLTINPEMFKGKTVTCTCCKTKFAISMFDEHYGSPKAYVTYKGPKFTRNICNDCHCKALDKLYGINAEAEDLLFKEDK